MIEKTMEVDRMEDVISVFGSFDQNLRMIETEYNVRVTDRDEQIHITGEAENVLYAEKAIAGLLSLAAKGEEIGEQNVRYIFRLVREGREQKIQELAGDVVCITAKGKPIKAKTLGQKRYVEAINNKFSSAETILPSCVFHIKLFNVICITCVCASGYCVIVMICKIDIDKCCGSSGSKLPIWIHKINVCFDV